MSKLLKEVRRGFFKVSLWDMEGSHCSDVKIQYGWRNKEGKWVNSYIYCYKNQLPSLLSTLKEILEDV